jgi:hypothetical protein
MNDVISFSSVLIHRKHVNSNSWQTDISSRRMQGHTCSATNNAHSWIWAADYRLAPLLSSKDVLHLELCRPTQTLPKQVPTSTLQSAQHRLATRSQSRLSPTISHLLSPHANNNNNNNNMSTISNSHIMSIIKPSLA